MENSKDAEAKRLSRRDMLKLSGLAVGGLALGSAVGGPPLPKARQAHTTQEDEQCATCTCSEDDLGCTWTDIAAANRYTYYDEKLGWFYPFTDATPTTVQPLGKNEMRITFMGSCVPHPRKTQQMMSVFVEVGWDDAKQLPLDNFIFDCGSGVCTNYTAMNVSFGRMDKVFINHLHGDHMSDLTHIYCFGPSYDRLSPLYVWGPKNSGVKSPAAPKRLYDDGVQAFCEHLRAACRWHTESFSFQNTSFTPDHPDNRPLMDKWGLPYEPKPVGDDDPNDGYAMVPIELDWEKGGVAYWNRDTGVKITFFKVIHARKGSIGYKLEFTPPNVDNPKTLTMIYTSDTKPETLSVEQAKNGGKGVDVFIHEMALPPRIWAMKFGHLTDPSLITDDQASRFGAAENSSHSPQGAFGYLLSLVEPRPRLTVATHFPVADDTVACAMKSVLEHVKVYQGADTPHDSDAARMTWSFDNMVITVSTDQIVEQKGHISNFEYSAMLQEIPGTKNTPKYHTADGEGDPYAQLDMSTSVPPCDCETGACNYREDGF